VQKQQVSLVVQARLLYRKGEIHLLCMLEIQYKVQITTRTYELGY